MRILCVTLAALQSLRVILTDAAVLAVFPSQMLVHYFRPF